MIVARAPLRERPHQPRDHGFPQPALTAQALNATHSKTGHAHLDEAPDRCGGSQTSTLDRGASSLHIVPALDVPDDLVSWIENVIAGRRTGRGLLVHAHLLQQSVTALLWLAKNVTDEQLASIFAMGARAQLRQRHDRPACDLHLNACRGGSQAAVRQHADPSLALRRAGDRGERRRLYNGKHHDHRMVVQVLSDTGGKLLFLGWAPCRVGTRSDRARDDRIVHAVTDAGIETIADSGYESASSTVRTPAKRPKSKGHNGSRSGPTAVTPGSFRKAAIHQHPASPAASSVRSCFGPHR